MSPGESVFLGKANARKVLVASARYAKSVGISPSQWQQHPEIIKIKNNFSLGEDIFTHIIAFVWSFSTGR